MDKKPKKTTLTRQRLLDSARELFAREWYETVSVSRICAHAGLSNGIFYSYFRRKEDIFRELLSLFLQGFQQDMEGISGGDIPERLSRLLSVIITAGAEYRDLVTIFREGQYRFPEYEKALRELYVDAVKRTYNRSISEAEYLYIISGVRFLSTRSLYSDVRVHLSAVQTFIEGGFFHETAGPDDRIFTEPARGLEDPEPGDSRGKILRAALQLFGEQSYYTVNVYEIARTAGFSVGTFYMHFESKEGCLAEIVRKIGHDTRRFISMNIDPRLNRLEIEMQGLHLFLKYFEKHKHYYNIVREAEFVINPAVTAYYDAFADGYIRGFGNLSRGDAVTAANMLMGIAHYLGIEVFFSSRIHNRRDLIKRLGALMGGGIRQ